MATQALKRKKASELELDRLAGTRLQLEMQVNTLESANLNAETMAAMKKAADALKVIHGNMCGVLCCCGSLAYHLIRNVDKVDATMAAVNEQRAVADEIADIISNPAYINAELDEACHLSFLLVYWLMIVVFTGCSQGRIG